MRLKSRPEKQPEDAIRDIRPATRPRAEFGLIQRQPDNPDAVPGRIRPSGTIRPGAHRIVTLQSCRLTQADSHSFANLRQHVLDEIGGEKPRAGLAVGDERDHHRAARTYHDRTVAGRQFSRNWRNRDVERPHELELLRFTLSFRDVEDLLAERGS
jgi:hypothetical protein